MQILLLKNERLWHSNYSLKLTTEQLCCTALNDCHHKQVMVQLLVCQKFLACSDVHTCTPYFASMLQIHFRRYLSHMRFAPLNVSRWAHFSRKKCTHFLIVLSQSHHHDQRPQKFALQMGVQVALACCAGLPP